MNLTSNLYGLRRNGVSHGDVFTSPRVVRFMLDLIGYTSDKDLSAYNVLEPSFGHGDFLIEIQNRLIQSAKKFNFDASEIMSKNIYGCEIDRAKYDNCIYTLKSEMPNFRPLNLKTEDFLFSLWDTQFDFIIGNPPYIRYENIPREARNLYKNKFYTFHYRSDLYVLFYEHCLKNLSVNGRHCFICSNRWLKNEYGKKLRALISSCYHLEYIIDVEKLDAFRELVLAYPSITLISNTGTDKNVKLAQIKDISELDKPIPFKQKTLESLENWDDLFLSDNVGELSSIEHQGFRIGIGVATGADKIFISKDLESCVEKELLMPLVNAKDLTRNEFNWKGSYILNPYNENGSILNLDKYPKAKQYLEQFKSILSRRHIVKNGRIWYSLIDKIKPELLNIPKILLPDISGNDIIFIDKGAFYPAHNIYYITGKSFEELELLAAILMSRFVRAQIECISNKMNGGLPRWQSQSIKRIKIPIISNIPPKFKDRLVDAYHSRNISDINEIVEAIINLECDKNSVSVKSVIPKSLFDYDYSRNIGFPGSGIQ